MTNTLNADLIYEILSVVEEIPEGRVATYGQIARMIGKDKKCAAGGKSSQPRRSLRRISLPSGGESRGQARSRLAGTRGASQAGGRFLSRRQSCGHEKASMEPMKER